MRSNHKFQITYLTNKYLLTYLLTYLLLLLIHVRFVQKTLRHYEMRRYCEFVHLICENDYILNSHLLSSGVINW